jgi:hypothetical protein
VYVLFVVEYDNSYRIMTVGVDSVLYGIPRRGNGHRSRCGPEVSGGFCEIQVMLEIVVDDLEFHKSILMAILIAPKELLGAGTAWAKISHFC